MTLLYLLVAIGLYGAWKFFRKQKTDGPRHCAYGDPSIQKILENSTQYSALKKRMAAANSFEERYFVSVGISREFSLKSLEKWTNSEPDSADALLCYGARMVQWSWSARGYGGGASVSEKKWALFFERLAVTKELLLRSAEKMPTDPTPWAYLIMVSTWAGDDAGTRQSYFNEATQRDPHNWAAHMHMIIALSEKWGGDNDDMVDFAERVSEDAPEGSDLPIIAIKAYIEYWKYMEMFEDRSEKAAEYLKKQRIRDAAVAAYERSLGSNKHTDTAVSVFARYNASAWFWMVKDQRRLKRELDTLGDKIEDIHWRWAGPEGDLKEARDFANGPPTVS